MLGVERAAIEVHDDGLRHSVRVGDVIDFEIGTWCPSASIPANRFGSTACSTRWHRTSPWRRRSARGSTPSASPTRARPGSRRPSSRGPPERVIAATPDRIPGDAGLAPAYAAARARFGIIALLLAFSGASWWWV